MVLTMLPVTAYAATQYYDLWVGGTAVSSDKLSGDGWRYEPETNTLVLNGFGIATLGYPMGKDNSGYYADGKTYQYANIYSNGGDINIRTEGKESYIGDPDFGNRDRQYEDSDMPIAFTGIYTHGGNVTATGSAKLNIGSNRRGICTGGTGSITFDNARDVEIVTYSGHDPVLGFIVGVFDIMTGRMTTIDKDGKVVSQVMENYSDRTESNLFAALAKQIIHFKSDITTSMGLPAPLMGLFDLLQFGSIGEEEQTIAEIVQGMYYEGYDFIHFCSLSLPVMITEVIVRLGYAAKRIKEGHTVKESVPVSLNRDKHPKLATMLFIAHAGATAANTGKIYFTQNPMSINYPQWVAFAKYSYSQIKWAVINKPDVRDAYVLNKVNQELWEGIDRTNRLFEEFDKEYIVVFE